MATIKNNRDEIVKIANPPLYVFESASSVKEYTKNSDLDILYRFKKEWMKHFTIQLI